MRALILMAVGGPGFFGKVALGALLDFHGFHHLPRAPSARIMAGIRYRSAMSKASITRSTISCTVDGANTRICKSPWPGARVACQ